MGLNTSSVPVVISTAQDYKAQWYLNDQWKDLKLRVGETAEHRILPHELAKWFGNDSLGIQSPSENGNGTYKYLSKQVIIHPNHHLRR